MGTAHKIVRRLLETSPYDIDDPLEKPEFPAGFIAVLPDDPSQERAEMHFDPQTKRYKFTRSYYDPTMFNFDAEGRNTGKVGKRVSVSVFHSVKMQKAAQWLKQQAAEWKNAGWTITIL